MIDYTGFLYPKARARVLERIDVKAQRAKDERLRRAAVDRRDARRCFWPGCKAYAREKHHIIPRSLGGTWTTENILSACSTHHRYFKAGLITVSGNPDHKDSVRVHMTALGKTSGVTL